MISSGGRAWQIIEAGPSYAAIASEIHCACFPFGWSSATFATLLGQPRTFSLIAAAPAQMNPFGFIVCRHVADEAEIVTLGVLPGHRRQGVGKSLLGSAIARFKQTNTEFIYLEVETGNNAAIGLYEQLGFSGTAVREGYYKRPNGRRDAAIMRLTVADRL